MAEKKKVHVTQQQPIMILSKDEKSTNEKIKTREERQRVKEIERDDEIIQQLFFR